MKTIKLFLTVAVITLILAGSNSVYPQSDPKEFKYFKILANAIDDSLFVTLQQEMGITHPLEFYDIIINIPSDVITIGSEDDPTSLKMEFSKLTKKTQQGLINWKQSNKFNLAVKKYDYSEPLISGTENIKPSKLFLPAKRERHVKGIYNYINPYFQLFGGQRIGAYFSHSFGTSFGIGTKYSGPLESDQISAGVHLFGININYITRLKGLNTHTPDANGNSGFWNQYNNIYSPPNAWEINFNFPIGNFLEFGIYKPFGDTKTGEAAYTYYENGDLLKPMPNNIVEGTYFNFELRFPFRFAEAVKSQVYAAYYLKEAHIGFFTNESHIGSIGFDLRTDYTISKIRNNQFLFELLFSKLFQGFGIDAIAVGPSFRISKLDNGKIGLHTLFLNARFKLGDYFDER